MNFSFLHDNDYLVARNNDDYYHFGRIPVPTPSWDEILREFDREYLIHLQTGDPNIFKYQERLGFVLHQCQEIPIVGRFLQAIGQNYHKTNQHFTALAYISLSSESATYGRHNDVMDVWCWQMTGHTLWQIEGRRRNFEKVLEPGELVYVPRGMWHNTKPMTPRAGLSFGSEDIR